MHVRCCGVCVGLQLTVEHHTRLGELSMAKLMLVNVRSLEAVRGAHAEARVSALTYHPKKGAGYAAALLATLVHRRQRRIANKAEHA